MITSQHNNLAMNNASVPFFHVFLFETTKSHFNIQIIVAYDEQLGTFMTSPEFPLLFLISFLVVEHISEIAAELRENYVFFHNFLIIINNLLKFHKISQSCFRIEILLCDDQSNIAHVFFFFCFR